MEKDYYALFAEHHRKLIRNVVDLGKRAEEDVLNTPELLTYLWERLVPHALGEEASLYKRAETLPGGSATVRLMVGEHEVIVQYIRELGQLFETREEAELRSVFPLLLALLHEHFQKEEEILTPLLRQHLAPEEFGTLIEEAHKVEREVKPSDIQRFMDADHRRVDRLIETFSALKRNDLGKATALFTRGRTGLLKHILWEEELLFPAFEDKTHMHGTGPTAVMGQEHAKIKAAIEKIVELLDAGELRDLERAEQELVSTLAVHNKKETLILYPMINKSLSAQERTGLLDKMV